MIEIDYILSTQVPILKKKKIKIIINLLNPVDPLKEKKLTGDTLNQSVTKDARVSACIFV
jgi:hypothetical protein